MIEYVTVWNGGRAALPRGPLTCTWGQSILARGSCGTLAFLVVFGAGTDALFLVNKQTTTHAKL